MRKPPEVEDAKALMTEAMDWSGAEVAVGKVKRAGDPGERCSCPTGPKSQSALILRTRYPVLDKTRFTPGSSFFYPLMAIGTASLLAGVRDQIKRSVGAEFDRAESVCKIEMQFCSL